MARKLPHLWPWLVVLMALIGLLVVHMMSDGKTAQISLPLASSTFVASCIDSAAVAELCTVSSDGQVTTGDIPVDAGAQILISPNRRQIAFQRAGEIWVLRGDGTMINTSEPGSVLDWLDDDSLLVSSPGSSLVAVLTLDDLSLVPWCPRTLHGSEVSHASVDARSVFAAISVVDRDSRTAVKRIDIVSCELKDLVGEHDGRVLDLSLSADGETLALLTPSGIVIYQVQSSGALEREVVPQLGPAIASPALSPDGDAVVYVDSRGALLRISLGDPIDRRTLVDQTDRSSLDMFPVLPDWS